SAGGIVFLRKVEPGPADRSYGIEVAKLAGLPLDVIERAREVLKDHEQIENRASALLSPTRDSHTPTPAQLTIFTPLSQKIVDRLRDADLNSITPLQALNLLHELKQQLD
ncbi:MAG TPA: DNA mismatch repair protein MutS, partial [Terriglobales bacterium]